MKAFEMISDLAHAQKISFAEHPDQPVINASSHCFSNQLGKFYYWLPHEVIEVWSTFLWRCVLDAPFFGVLDVSLFCLECLLVGGGLECVLDSPFFVEVCLGCHLVAEMGCFPI